MEVHCRLSKAILIFAINGVLAINTVFNNVYSHRSQKITLLMPCVDMS